MPVEPSEINDLDNIHNPSNVTDYGEIPDGTYIASLDSIFIDKSKSSGRLQTIMKFKIEAGAYKGQSIRKYAGMETSEHLDYLTRDLRAMGAPKDFKWSNISVIFKDLLDTTVEISQQEKNGFKNVYINKVVEVSQNAKSNDVPF